MNDNRRSDKRSSNTNGDQGAEAALPARDEDHASDQDQQLVEFLQALSEDRRRQFMQSLLSVEHVEFSGPLPSPDHLEKYNEILPGAADRIIKMAEKEQENRSKLQLVALRNERFKVSGSIIIGVGLLAVAGIATWFNQPLIALPLGLGGTITVIIRQILNFLDRAKSVRSMSSQRPQGGDGPGTDTT